MPLYANNETSSGVLNGFHDAIRRERDGLEVAASMLDGLMMITVYFDVALTGKPPNQTVFGESNKMPRRISRRVGRVVCVMGDGSGNNRRDILNQRAAAIDVQALNTEAN